MTEKERRELEVSQKKEIETTQGEPTKEGVMFVPEVDIIEEENHIQLLADLPGVNKDDLQIDLREGVLTLTATVEPPPAHMKPVYQEYEIGGYQRKFNLGERIDQGKISAKFNNGVLTLTLPKTAEYKPRKIEIKS